MSLENPKSRLKSFLNGLSSAISALVLGTVMACTNTLDTPSGENHNSITTTSAPDFTPTTTPYCGTTGTVSQNGDCPPVGIIE